MALELQNNLIKVNKVLGETTTKNIIEEDIIVPDSKPDVVSILQADAQIKVRSKEVYRDMIVIRGTADFKILYMSDDTSKLICSIDYGTKFDYTIDIPGIDQDMKSMVSCGLEHLDCSILNGRKLNIKSILDIEVRVSKTEEVCAVTCMPDEQGFQSMTKMVDTFNTIDYDASEVEVQYEAEIPVGKAAIKEILKNDAYIKEKEVKIAGNKAMIKGTIEVSTLYSPDMGENKIDFVVNEVQFSEMVDVEEVELADNYNISIDLADVKAEVKEDDDGDSRVVGYDIILSLKPYSVEKQSYEIVSDAYSISSKLETEKTPVKLNKLVEDTKIQMGIKDSVHISDIEDARRIYTIMYKPMINDVRIDGDKLLVDGTVDTVIMYLSQNENNPFETNRHYIPFKHSMDIRGLRPDMKPEIRAEIDNFTYSVRDGELEMKFNVAMYVRIMDEMYCDVITKIEEMPIDSNMRKVQPSMTVYYVQNGDTLWNIAKKYLTTVGEIIRINNMENSDMIMVGQQLLIPKMS